jgi:hypothetical protein
MSITIFVSDKPGSKGSYVKGDKDSPVGGYLKKIQGLDLCEVEPKSGNLGCDTVKTCTDKAGACKLFHYKLGFDGIHFSIADFSPLEKDYKITAADQGWYFLCQCCTVKKLNDPGHGLRIAGSGNTSEDEDISGTYPDVNKNCKLGYIEGSRDIAGIEMTDPGLWIYCEQDQPCDQGDCEMVRLEPDGDDLKPVPQGKYTRDNPYKVDFEKDKDCIFVCSCSQPPLQKKHHKKKK